MLSSPVAHLHRNRDLWCSGWVLMQIALLHKVAITCSSLADSMDYFTSVLSVRPLSAKSQGSSHSPYPVQNKDSILETPSPEACIASGDEVVPTSPKVKRHTTSARRKTTLHFCRPPPITKQKRLHFRPKVLLQLQKTSEAARPVPTFDVLSSAGFASRLAKEFPSAFKGKYGFGMDDLVVVGSEDYSSRDVQDEEADDVLQKDTLKSRDIVAAIAQYAEDKHDGHNNIADIYMSDGRSWIGSPMPKGGYEFASVDQQGQRMLARWVPRRGSRKHMSGQGVSPLESPTEERSFTFSLINPTSRRHAVIATFDSPTLEILDRYNTPLTESANRPPSATSEKGFLVGDSVEVDEALRTLIIVTSVWVSFCEGYFGPDHILTEPTKTQALPLHYKRRSHSVNTKGYQRHSITASYNSGSTIMSPRPTSIQSPTSLAMPTSPVNTLPMFLTPPRRTQSTGTTVLDRLYRRPTIRREAEIPSPVLDPPDVSSFESRTPAPSEQPRLSNVHSRSFEQQPKPEKEQKKRTNGIRKLCCSIKGSARGS